MTQRRDGAPRALHGQTPTGIRSEDRTSVTASPRTAAAQQQAMVDQAAAQAAAQVQAQQAAAAHVAAPAPAADSTDDKIAKIKEPGQLKEAGLLTDEEFVAEKAKVLAG
jgi:hypothetical protein